MTNTKNTPVEALERAFRRRVLGAPTGKRVAIPFVTTYTCADGLFADFRLYFDQLDLISQLGL